MLIGLIPLNSVISKKTEFRFEMLFDTLKLRPILIVNRAAKCHYSYSNQISKT